MTAVEVSLQRTTDSAAPSARVDIRDHGPGVPDDALSSIFQPFYRVSDARESRSGGAGLGLAITQRAVSLQGGTVSAMNATGGGLIVRIELRCAALQGV